MPQERKSLRRWRISGQGLNLGVGFGDAEAPFGFEGGFFLFPDDAVEESDDLSAGVVFLDSVLVVVDQSGAGRVGFISCEEFQGGQEGGAVLLDDGLKILGVVEFGDFFESAGQAPIVMEGAEVGEIRAVDVPGIVEVVEGDADLGEVGGDPGDVSSDDALIDHPGFDEDEAEALHQRGAHGLGGDGVHVGDAVFHQSGGVIGIVFASQAH